MRSICKFVLAAVAVLGFCAPTLADTIWIGTGSGAIKADGVKILQTESDKLQYVTDAGMQAGRQMSQLSQINVDGEADFNAAENAFAARDFDSAITSYESVLTSSSAKEWELLRSAQRLSQAARIRNRFDAEVVAYTALVLKVPTAAAAIKPGEPAEHSQYLDPGLASISRAMDNSQLNDSQKSALLGLQLQIERAKGDNSQVNATLQQLVALGGASDADKSMLKILGATVAYDSGKYAEAADDIQQNRALFSDPAQQVDALFVLAQARAKMDGDKTDPDVQKDLALNFMRVVTFGSELPDRPHVAQSLYAAGQIEEKLKETSAAATLYKQVISGYPNSPVAAEARTALERVGGK